MECSHFGKKLQIVTVRRYYEISELHNDDDNSEVHAYGKIFMRR
jgi:hypothetical protein